MSLTSMTRKKTLATTEGMKLETLTSNDQSQPIFSPIFKKKVSMKLEIMKDDHNPVDDNEIGNYDAKRDKKDAFNSEDSEK
jgi:hypothetical protein